MEHIIVYTQAYNAEKTLCRAVDSILAQNFIGIPHIYRLIENGSGDNTRALIEGYAQKNEWIIPGYNDANVKGLFPKELPRLLNDYPGNGYLFVLDADDAYHPDFFENALSYMLEENLDIALCGSEFIDSKTNKLFNRRQIDKKLIISDEGFSEHFTLYHQFMRTIWGKVFRLGLLRECDMDKIPPGYYGGDTLFSIEAFRHASRIGILPGTLHEYYISPQSVSYQWNPRRIESDRFLDDVTRAFLMEKCGEILPINEALLITIYSNAIGDTVKLLLHCDMAFLERINNLKDIAEHEKTQALISILNDIKLDNKFRSALLSWLIEQNECRWPEGAGIAADILLALYRHLRPVAGSACLTQLFIKLPKAIEPLCAKEYANVLAQLRTWYNKHDPDNALFTELEIKLLRAAGKPGDEIFELLLHIRSSRPTSSEQLDIDARIADFFTQYPLLSYVTAGLAYAFSHTVCLAINEDYANALESFFDSAEDIDIADEDSEAFLTLGQNLAAAAEDTGAFIYFKKVWISWLLDAGRYSDAAHELNEFEELLPNDEDLSAMRMRLNG